jgi:hypothetical protein
MLAFYERRMEIVQAMNAPPEFADSAPPRMEFRTAPIAAGSPHSIFCNELARAQPFMLQCDDMPNCEIIGQMR